MKQRDVFSKMADLGALPNTAAGEPTNTPATRAKTAVGKMFSHVSEGRSDRAELDAVRAKLGQFEGSAPTRRIDPKRIRPSRFENRIEQSFATEEFRAFKEEIASSGGNVQPIRVRPISEDGDIEYEIAYGHRRYRACLELGVPVLAEIVELTDEELFECMTRENVGRNDLSPYEWGLHYQRALKHGVYMTQEQLAGKNNRSQAHVALCLQLAALPSEVVGVFPTPLAMQLKWGGPLLQRWKSDGDEVRKVIGEIQSAGDKMTAVSIFQRLNGKARAPARKSIQITQNGKNVARVEEINGVVTVRFARGIVDAGRLRDIETWARDFVGK